MFSKFKLAATVFILAFGFASPVFSFGLEPVPGSCRVESKANNWCHCDFVDAGTRASGSISCAVLSCQHYKNFESDRSCNYPHPSVSCVFLNPSYAGGCIENFELKQGMVATAVCQSVLTCLQNTQCIQSYCNATTIRRGWHLDSVVEHR